MEALTRDQVDRRDAADAAMPTGPAGTNSIHRGRIPRPSRNRSIYEIQAGAPDRSFERTAA